MRTLWRMSALGLGLMGYAVACGGDDSGAAHTGSQSTGSGGASSGAGSTGSSAGGAAGADANTTSQGSELCELGCEATLDANCDNGPVDQESCVATCERLRAESCGSEYSRFQRCAEGESIGCADGIPVVAACASEQADFIACVNR